MPEKEAHAISHHILGASTTLLGICFAIFDPDQGTGSCENQRTCDEFAVLPLSLPRLLPLFLWLDAKPETVAAFGKISDALFIAGLMSLCLLSVLISFNVVR